VTMLPHPVSYRDGGGGSSLRLGCDAAFRGFDVPFLSSRTRVNEHGESDKDGVRPWSRRLVGDKLDGALRIIGVGVFIGGWDKSLSACPTSTR
jgi:hypothetical protein